MKKIISLMLSLLLCLSLLTNHAAAMDNPESTTPPDQVEVLGTEEPDGSDDPGIMPLVENSPERDDTRPVTGGEG